MWQPVGSVSIATSDLAIPLARSLVKYLGEHCPEFARVLETRRMESGVEVVSFELDVELPQYPFYEFEPIEIVTVCLFPGNASNPIVAVARADFPDTPHQALVFQGLPSFLCVDDRPWQDIRGSYTASELVGRIANWFSKGAQGELHGIDQPFEPVFNEAPRHEIILTQEAEAAIARDGRLDIWATDHSARFLVVTSGSPTQPANQGNLHLHVAHATVSAERMRRMRRAPRNLRELAEILVERGVCLPKILAGSIDEWMTKGRGDRDTQWVFVIIVTMPQIHPATGATMSVPMAFVCETSPGRIGLGMGLLTNNDSDQADGVNYLRMLLAEPSIEGLETFPVSISNLHREFDERMACAMSSVLAEERRLTMIGAGSLGSSLSEILVRQGQFRWTIIDDDDFLPHNSARHTLTKFEVGLGKAMKVAARLRTIRSDVEVSWIKGNVLRDAADAAIASAVSEADIILDASASIPVARSLSDLASDARRICAFFTPNGRSAVLMVETADRSVDLRGIEACYLRAVLTDPSLENHLGAGQEMRYTGACRALTNRIPTSSVSLLTGLIAVAITEAVGEFDPVLKIWTMEDGGSVRCLRPDVSMIEARVEDWNVAIPAQFHAKLVDRRQTALPDETGGALVGILDYEAKRIDILDALEPPPDSVGNPRSFVRGTRRLRRQIENAMARSGGQVRYVGEWHSHPDGAAASPSGTDLDQIRQLSLLLEMDDLPAISIILSDSGMGIIVGETRS